VIGCKAPRMRLLAWWIPKVAIVAGLLASFAVRTTIWTVALAWMGVACILNAKRCGRTHCRFTGPYYLAMIVPVVVLGTSLVSAGPYAWLALACVIPLGGRLLWWGTEHAWGKFS
jgi:hypothetical protein